MAEKNVGVAISHRQRNERRVKPHHDSPLQKVAQTSPRHRYPQLLHIAITFPKPIHLQEHVTFQEIEERPHAIKMSIITNGHKSDVERIANHTEEKHLPGGWVVLKFGGTSVGKFAENIAGIVK